MGNERGSALLVAVFVLTVLTMLAIGVVATATTDLKISDNYNRSVRNLYAADAGANIATSLLRDDPVLGNLAPYPSGTPLTTGTIGKNTYSIWLWNARLNGNGTTTAFPDTRSRQFRIRGEDPTGNGTRIIEGVIDPSRSYPKTLDYSYFACGNVSLTSTSTDEAEGPIYSGGSVNWTAKSNGAGSSIQAFVNFNGPAATNKDMKGYIWANGVINNNYSKSTLGCKAGVSIANTAKCTGGAASAPVFPLPVTNYCNAAGANYNPAALTFGSADLDKLHDDATTVDTDGWSTGSGVALNNSIYYVTGGDVTWTNNSITYSGENVVVVDGGNFRCVGCDIGGGSGVATITVITRGGDILLSGDAQWNNARVVLFSGVANADGTYPVAGGNVTSTSAKDVEIKGEIYAHGNILSNGTKKLEVNIDDMKPQFFGDVNGYAISEWREVR